MHGTKHYELRLPDLGLGDAPVCLSLWLVKRGARVAAGDPVVEILCDAVTVDLSAPCDGALVKRHAGEGDTLALGQTLATFAEDDGDPGPRA